MKDIRLTTFITLSNLKSFTKTAQVLNMTQPAISQHIKHLEDIYGVKLIERNGKNLNLTEQGKILLKYAKRIEFEYRELEDTIKNKNLLNQTYKLGASMTIGGYVLPYILGEYKKIHKNIDILLEVKNTEEILANLLNGDLDFAFIEGPFDKNIFKHNKYKYDELVLALSPLNNLSNKSQVTIEDIIKGNLILRERGSGTRVIFENILNDRGYNMENIKKYMEIGSISAIKALVELNLGYTVISRETIKKELNLGTIIEVPIKNIKIFREFNFVYLKEKDFINNFIEFSLNIPK
ncbi:MAG: LysR family transcriptional regulator [Clostridiaceae bacterium]